MLIWQTQHNGQPSQEDDAPDLILLVRVQLNQRPVPKFQLQLYHQVCNHLTKQLYTVVMMRIMTS